MVIATGIIVGIVVVVIGWLVAQFAGFFLMGAGTKVIRAKRKPGALRSLFAGSLSVSGILFLAAGPLAALWAGISSAVAIIGG